MMNVMKTFAIAAAAIITAVSASAQTFEDDIYYSAPSKKDKSQPASTITYTPAQLPAGARTSITSAPASATATGTTKVSRPVTSTVTDYPAADSYQAVAESAYGRQIDVDEYNRRGFFATDSAYAASVPVYEQVATQAYYYPDATDVTIEADGSTVVTSGSLNLNINAGYPSAYYWGNPYYNSWYDPWYYPAGWSFSWGVSPWYWGPSWSWGGYWPAYGPAYRPVPRPPHRPSPGRPGPSVRPGHGPGHNPGYRPGPAYHPGNVRPGAASASHGYRPAGSPGRPGVGANTPGRPAGSSVGRPAGSSVRPSGSSAGRPAGSSSVRPSGSSSAGRPGGSSSPSYSTPSRGSSSSSSYSRPSSGGSRGSGSFGGGSRGGGSRGGGGRH